MTGKEPPKSPLGDEDRVPAPGKTGRRFRSGFGAFILEAMASVALLYFASHVRVDRSRRIPVVHFSGPLGDRVEWLAVAAWALSLLALWPAISTAADDGGSKRTRSDRICGHAAVLLAFINLLGCCAFGSQMET